MLRKYSLFLFLAVCVFAASAKKCPEGSVESVIDDTMCYTWSKTKATYFDAEMACQQKRGHLATIHDAEENSYLLKLLANEGLFFWIGINDRESYGKWKWEDGSSVNYLNRGKGQPGEYHCGILNHYDNHWWTYKCSEKNNYLCLIPAI